MKYVALLRGVNVGGNSMVKMADLKAGLENNGFNSVKTYINSGNIIFEQSNNNVRELELIVESILRQDFGIANKVVIVNQEDYARIIARIPSHWLQTTALRCNVIFLRHEIDSPSILKNLQPKPEIEEVYYAPGALLWAANTSDLTKSTMIKLAKTEIYKNMTVRNLNTTLKISQLFDADSN